MAIKILERSYSEIYTDGLTDWMLGNVGEWQKLKLKCEVGIEFLGSQQSPIEIDYINNAFIISSGDAWGAYGFDAGMVAVFSYKISFDTTGNGEFDTISSVQRVYTITNIFNNTMEVSEPIEVDGFDTIPTNFGSKKITEVLFYVSEIPEGCRITYGHITNEEYETEQLNSFIDSTESEFAFPGLNNLDFGEWRSMEPVGIQSGMSIRDIKTRKVLSFSSDSGVLGSYKTNSASFRMTPQNAGSGIGDDRDFKVLPLTKINGLTDSFYQNNVDNVQVPVTSEGEPTTIVSNGCFIYNADEEFTQDILLDFDFKLVNTNEFSNLDNFSIVLLRFAGGSSLTFSEKTYLKTWIDARSLIGRVNNINHVESLDVSSGDSYAIAFEFENDSGNAYWIDIETNDNGMISLSNKNTIFSSPGKTFFEFEIEYMISSLFEDLSNFQNLEMPSYLTGNGSLTDNFRIEFYPEWNNPNVMIKNDMSKTRRLGNTGWFNENFNELANDFNIESVKYFDNNGNPIDSLDYSASTKVQITIAGVPNLNANTECGFGFAWIPINEDDYREKSTPFYRNCFVQSGSLENGFLLGQLYTDTFFGAGTDGGSMDTSQIKFTSVSGKIVMEANFIPNGSFFNIFDSKNENDRNYVLWVSVADGSLERNFSDRVALLADSNSMAKNIPPAGNYEGIQNAFIEHPFDETNVGVESLEGIVQDDILCRMPLRIPTDGSKVFERITFGVEAYNIGLNESQELEKYEVDLTQFPITSDGVRQIDVDTVRGFKLEPNNNKNWVKINREDDLDVLGLAGFICYFGTKIRWEDWILRNNVDTAFFNENELNNGFHNDWINYLRTQGWKIKYFTEIISRESGELYEYKNRWDMSFVDYDENVNIAVTHKYYRDSDDTLLNVGTDPETNRPFGVIISNEPTRIEIEFEILDSGVWDLSTTYAVTTIEIDKGAGRFEQRQLSSVWGSENDNPLKPVEGETKLKIEVDGTNKFLKTSCLVDPDLLDDALKYRITGRVGCKDDDGNEFTTGLYEFRYQENYE